MKTTDLKTVVRKNIREYTMFIALGLIILIFTLLTENNVFLSSRNISNVLDQAGYMAVLAIGMTLVIVIRHIDLSVGFLVGFLGAVAAIMLVSWGIPVYFVIPLILILGIAASLLISLPVAMLGVPSFVSTLAGMLIFHGLLIWVLTSTGTIIIDNEFFLALGNGFIPDLFPIDSPVLPGIHKLTLMLGAVAIVLYVITQIRSRVSKLKYDFEVLHPVLFVIKLVFISGIIGSVTWILAGFNGLSWTVVIVLVVLAVYHFITTRTILGRHIYATGGNPEAAGLSGINVKKITFLVFGSMGLMSGVSAILYTARMYSASPQAGTLFELDAIAAAYIGGVSAAGGVGKVAGSIVGALVYISLTKGMDLMQVDIAVQYILRGIILLAAVILDVLTRRTRK